MFSSIRSRMVAATVATVVVALVAKTTANYVVADRYSSDLADRVLTFVLTAHQTGIGDWAASRKHMIESLRDVALPSDPDAALKQVKTAGGLLSAYIGHADKTSKFSEASDLPPNWDPTVRPWCRQAVEAGTAVLTQPYVDAETGRLVVTFAVPLEDAGVIKGGAADVTMDRVIANIRSIHPTPASFGTLVDLSGHVIAAQDSRLTLTPVTAVAAREI